VFERDIEKQLKQLPVMHFRVIVTVSFPKGAVAGPCDNEVVDVVWVTEPCCLPSDTAPLFCIWPIFFFFLVLDALSTA